MWSVSEVILNSAKGPWVWSVSEEMIEGFTVLVKLCPFLTE